MKIGLYFGSFNPVHVGHLIIASHIADNADIQQVWFIISPQNPLKKNNSLLNAYHRLHLVQLAIEDDTRLRASNVEFNLPKPSYTIDTLAYLKEKYSEHEFSVILGSDSFSNLHKWKNYEQLILENTLIVYPRPGFPVSNANVNTIMVKAPFLEISSTMIRELIKAKKSIRYLVPEKVREEIEKNNYYKS